jgi:hypothetical protein
MMVIRHSNDKVLLTLTRPCLKLNPPGLERRDEMGIERPAGDCRLYGAVAFLAAPYPRRFAKGHHGRKRRGKQRLRFGGTHVVVGDLFLDAIAARSLLFRNLFLSA